MMPPLHVSCALVFQGAELDHVHWNKKQSQKNKSDDRWTDTDALNTSYKEIGDFWNVMFTNVLK